MAFGDSYNCPRLKCEVKSRWFCVLPPPLTVITPVAMQRAGHFGGIQKFMLLGSLSSHQISELSYTSKRKINLKDPRVE